MELAGAAHPPATASGVPVEVMVQARNELLHAYQEIQNIRV